ncbi:unnamed protein product [Callosobruchus maculatus]|uniref:Doublecortin domain-containing protein n=1 Tax=Callosobruchus maculatus TaxID=64391 RepID=A0A653CC11_CALMS|nr:unnamed protein product [Callosobruchus maculatus]
MEGQPHKVSSKLAEPLYGRSKKIYVFENGDRYSKCFAPVINPKVLKTWRNILQYLTEKITPSFGAIEYLVNLKTMEKITCFEELEVDEKYVALGQNGQFVNMKYLTDEEQKIKLKKCRKKRFYMGELDPSKKYFFEETEKRGLTVVFVMTNGGGNHEPKKFVFSIQDLANWPKTLVHIGKAMDIDGLINLSTIFGDPIEESCQLQHGFLYVAVPYNQEFIACDYEQLFNGWSGPNDFKLKILPASNKGMVKFVLDVKPVESPPKKPDSPISSKLNVVGKHQSILRLSDIAIQENLVLPDTNVTLFEGAMERKRRHLRDSIVLMRSSFSKDQVAGMLARPDHLNECVANICGICDPKGTECPDCMDMCQNGVTSQRVSTDPCPGECETPCKKDLICCPVCSCIIKIPDARKKKVQCSKSCDYFQTHMESCPVCECDGSKHERECSEEAEESKGSVDTEDSLISPSSTRVIHSNLLASMVSDVNPASMFGIGQEKKSSSGKPSASEDSISGPNDPSHEEIEDVKDECAEECPTKGETGCTDCKCADSKGSAGCESPDSSRKDSDLSEEITVAPIEEPKAPATQCSDSCSHYRKHGTPCLICECGLEKTPSLRISSPTRHSDELKCDSNCEYFRKTGIQYPHCRCDELENILQLVLLEAQTIVCDREQSTDDTIEGSKRLSKDSTDPSLKKSSQKKSKDANRESSKELCRGSPDKGSKDSNDTSKQTKSKVKQKVDCASNKCGKKSKINKSNNPTACSCQSDKKPKAPPPKKRTEPGKDKKSCKKAMSIDSLETEDVAKKRLDPKTKKCAKRKNIEPVETNINRTTECSANIRSFKLSVQCKTMKLSDRNIGATCHSKQSTNKCSSNKALDRISESSSKTTNTTSETEMGCGCDERDSGGKTSCPIIYEAPSSCEVKEELLQQLTHIAVGIEDQHCCSTKIETQIAVVSQSCKTTSPTNSNVIECSGSCGVGEKELEGSSKQNEVSSPCSAGQDGGKEQPKATATPPSSPCSPSSPSSCTTEEDNVEEIIDNTIRENVEEEVEEDVEEEVEEKVEKCVENDQVCGGCLSPTCQCPGRLGDFCDCDTSVDDEPAKYILICDSTCDFLKRTGNSCRVGVGECESCNEEGDENRQVKTCEKSIEADLREVTSVDHETQVGESCVCVNHEPYSTEVCMRNVCYDYCCEEILSDISEDSLESCCVLKAVKEEVRLIKKARCLSIEDVYKASRDKKCRPKEKCCFPLNDVQGIRIKNKMDVNFYGGSGAKHHYSKTKKYKSCPGSYFTFVSEPSTGESDRLSSEGAEM